MITDLFGPASMSYKLRGSLDEAMAVYRGIATRVAGLRSSSGETDFSQALDKAMETEESVDGDLQGEMAALADTQIRYETQAKLLHGTYAGLRAAIRGNG